VCIAASHQGAKPEGGGRRDRACGRLAAGAVKSEAVWPARWALGMRDPVFSPRPAPFALLPGPAEWIREVPNRGTVAGMDTNVVHLWQVGLEGRWVWKMGKVGTTV